jgi:hypothetical protein
MTTTSFTLVGNSADAPAPLLKPLRHVAEILAVSGPDFGYDAARSPHQSPR